MDRIWVQWVAGVLQSILLMLKGGLNTLIFGQDLAI